MAAAGSNHDPDVPMHVFVTRGIPRNIACDAWLLPCDDTGETNPHWSMGDLPDRWFQDDDTDPLRPSVRPPEEAPSFDRIRTVPGWARNTTIPIGVHLLTRNRCAPLGGGANQWQGGGGGGSSSSSGNRGLDDDGELDGHASDGE